MCRVQFDRITRETNTAVHISRSVHLLISTLERVCSEDSNPCGRIVHAVKLTDQAIDDDPSAARDTPYHEVYSTSEHCSVQIRSEKMCRKERDDSSSYSTNV